MKYDWAWKSLFELPLMAEYLLRGFTGPVVSHLDLDTLDKLSASWTGEDAEQRHGDALWRVLYRDGSGRSLVVPMEFRSTTVDPTMTMRALRYVGMAHEALRKQDALDPDGRLRALPMVVHSYNEWWTAPGAAEGTEPESVAYGPHRRHHDARHDLDLLWPLVAPSGVRGAKRTNEARAKESLKNSYRNSEIYGKPLISLSSKRFK